MSDVRLASTLHNLPQTVTRFVGRGHEITEIRRLLGSCRLLTLTGAGGVGKTRLGQEVAGRVADSYEHGVWLVELAALADPTLVPREVAAALGVREAADSTPDRSLLDALADRRLLLILDNCEHLLQAVADLVTHLLRACSGLQILTTSRQPLGIAGETTYRVPSLSLAPADQPGISEAVSLFVERARASLPAFTLNDRDAAIVRTICERLDGIPLAIELAAARISVLTPEQIAARLDDRFRLLTGGSRTALPRYRTLRALIDWSYDLLDDRERTLWRRLAVFAGGWTLDAAEGVCADEVDAPPGLARGDILDLLSDLVSRSIVQADVRGGEVRYAFLESLRAYADERLQEASESNWLRARHCDWYVALAERAEQHLNGPEAIPWLDRLEQERENLRLALGWCVEQGEVSAGLRLAGALCRFWLVRGPYAETRAILHRLVTMPARQQEDSAARPAALWTAGWLAMRQDDRQAAQTYFQEALVLSQERGDRHGVSVVRYLLGLVARVHGDYPAALREYADAHALFSTLGEETWIAHIGLELGIMAFYQGNLSEARQHHTASLAIFQAHHHELGIMLARNELGEVALRDGALDEARGHLCASLKVAFRAGDMERVAMNLAALAGLAAAEQQPVRALRLVGVALALNESTGQLNSPAWHAMLDRWLEPARAALSPVDAAAALAAGRALPLTRAVEQALDATDATDPAAAPPDAFPTDADAPATDVHPPCREPAGPGGPALSVVRGCDQSCAVAPVATPVKGVSGLLTRRELEVAGLVARGLTNRQIAAELIITEGTAANHVKHILARLGLDSRVQVAAWAVEHGVHRPASASA